MTFILCVRAHVHMWMSACKCTCALQGICGSQRTTCNLKDWVLSYLIGRKVCQQVTIHCSSIKKTKRQIDTCFLRRQVFAKVQSPFFFSSLHCYQYYSMYRLHTWSVFIFSLAGFRISRRHFWAHLWGHPQSSWTEQGRPPCVWAAPSHWLESWTEGGWGDREIDRQTDDWERKKAEYQHSLLFTSWRGLQCDQLSHCSYPLAFPSTTDCILKLWAKVLKMLLLGLCPSKEKSNKCIYRFILNKLI